MKIFKCPVCGKVTSGRMPRNGDTSMRYPRRHKHNGKPCEGNTQEAIWLGEEVASGNETAVASPYRMPPRLRHLILSE